MIFAIDFDGVVVDETTRTFADVTTPLRFQAGAREGLRRLKAARHTLVIYSARTNRALLYSPDWDPLVRAGVRLVDRRRWEAERPLHWARYFQMRRFVEVELPGVIDVIDDGLQGKPLADAYIDNRAVGFGPAPEGVDWRELAARYG